MNSVLSLNGSSDLRSKPKSTKFSVQHLIAENEPNETSNFGQNLEAPSISVTILDRKPFDPHFFKKDLLGTKSKDSNGSSNSLLRYPLFIFFM
jgi:hypothetical protein